jgi:hypothetical protein
MPYMLVEDFSLGMDLRRSPVTASPKSARLIRNGFVNAGGEIEKRKSFYLQSNQLMGTLGLGSLGLGLWVFGWDPRPGTLPGFINYQQLTSGVAPWLRVSDIDVFDNKFYVVTEVTPNVYQHYYNGVVVSGAPNSASATAHRSKMYAVDGSIVYFSALNNPADWVTGGGATDAGFIQLDGQDEGSVSLIGLATYYDQLALFSRSSVQLWAMDEDPSQNQLIQTVGGTGLVAPQGLARFATGDVLFMHDSGVRSLKARDMSNAASVSDIGSPMDEELRKIIQNAILTGGPNIIPTSLKPCKGVVEPSTGQFWLSINDRIYVLSLAPSADIVAWSRYEPGFMVDYMHPVGSVMWVRSGNSLFAYGNGPAEAYDTSELEVILPMIAGNEPATDKMFTGLDAALEGTWIIEVGTDVQQPDVKELVATVGGPTFNMQNLGLQNFGTHIGIRARCSDPIRARLANVMVHYNKGADG